MNTHLLYSLLVLVITILGFYAIYFFVFYKKVNNLYSENLILKNNFEVLSKKANDIILAIDVIYGTIYNANIQASELLGYSNSELLSKTIHDLHPEKLLNLSSRTIARVWDEKGLVYQNLPFKCANGELIDVECSAKVLVYDEKPVIVIYARDIRERLKLERDIKAKNQLIADKNKDITSSINAASRIQKAILGQPQNINRLFPESFVFYKPHSIVSGDFYWFQEIGDYKIVAAADCTGHGVPGAFMTVLGQNFLEEIVGNLNIIMPNKILKELDNRVSHRLSDIQDHVVVQDGMDIAILTFDTKNNKVYYAGAMNPLCMIKNNKIELIKASKFSIGGQILDKVFELHEFNTSKDVTYYIYSDGFQDQFGGAKNRKYMSSHFRELLLKMSNLSPEAQKQELDKELEQWRNNLSQTDDILVIGIKPFNS